MEPIDDWLDPNPDTPLFVIELDGAVVGSIQVAEESSADYRHAGIDLFLDSEA